MTNNVTGRDAGATPGIRQTIQGVRVSVATETGIAQGTRVLTLDGALPVEFLTPGDRIITRSGMRLLRAVQVTTARMDLVRVSAGTLGHDRPERPLLLGARAQVLVRDWRARAIFGKPEALVDLARLVDGTHVSGVRPAGRRLFTLHFDHPEVAYAEGVEIGAAVASVRA